MLDVLQILLFGAANLALGFYLHVVIKEVRRRREERRTLLEPVATKVMNIVNEVDQATLEHSESCTDLKRLLIYKGDPNDAEIRTHINSNKCFGRLLNSYRDQLDDLDPDNQIVTPQFREGLSDTQTSANELTSDLRGFNNNTDAESLGKLIGRLQKLETSNQSLRRELKTAHEKIQVQMSRLEFAEAAALEDILTKLPNRRAYEDKYEELETALKENGESFCLLLIDLDHFKKINDQHGHIAGDAVLQVVAHVIKDTVRRNDFVARFGGEEFVVLTPGATLSTARYIAEQIRDRIENSSVVHKGLNLNITCSIGVSEARRDCLGDRLYEAADGLLFAAKDAGRNKVRIQHAALVSVS